MWKSMFDHNATAPVGEDTDVYEYRFHFPHIMSETVAKEW